MDKYKISATIEGKYAPLISRSRMLHEQTPKAEFPDLRARGATNIDLWTDGSIYPSNPESSKRPSFRSVSDLLQFVGDSRNGLLGYVQSLCQSDSTFQYRLQQTEMELLSMREQLQTLI